MGEKAKGENQRPAARGKAAAGRTPRPSKTTAAVPGHWRSEIERVLITPETIHRRVRAVARQIESDYRGRDLVIVALLNGTILFLSDLIRNLPLPLHLDFIGVSSYRDATSAGRLVWTKSLTMDIRNRDVLVVDDILDTGATLARVTSRLKKFRPGSLKICVLLDKPSRRILPIQADYTGFEIPDAFVVGYGLDYAEKYRNLPFIGILRNELTKGSK